MQHSRKKRAWSSPSRLVKVVAALVVGVTVALASPLAASAAETPWDVADEDIRSTDGGSAATWRWGGSEIEVWRGAGDGATRLYYSINGGTPREIPGGARTESAPVVANWNDRMIVMHRGTGAYNNRVFWTVLYDGYSNWGLWDVLPESVQTLGTPAIVPVEQGTRLQVVFRGTNWRMYTGYLNQNYNWRGQGEIWGDGVTPSSPAVTEIGILGNDQIMVVHRGVDDRLYAQYGYIEYGTGFLVWRHNWVQIPGSMHTDTRPVLVAGGANNENIRLGILTPYDNRFAYVGAEFDRNAGTVNWGTWIYDYQAWALAAVPYLYRLYNAGTFRAFAFTYYSNKGAEKQIW
jgi:hypothetical protein